tara:strand:- start:69 stop:224 length:156 start_codon:yes stop_codon:yes gene_type:complete
MISTIEKQPKGVFQLGVVVNRNENRGLQQYRFLIELIVVIGALPETYWPPY